LIEDGFVQANLDPNIPTPRFDTGCIRLRHIPNPQVLDAHDREVSADRCRDLVQVVAAGVADANIYTLDSGLRLLPVVAEFLFAGHRLLRTTQRRFMPFEAIQGRVVSAVGKSGETGNTYLALHCARRGQTSPGNYRKGLL
jgi:hypothetical protein